MQNTKWRSSPLFRVSCGVITVHVIVLFWTLCTAVSQQPPMRQPRQLVAKTVTLQPKQQQITAAIPKKSPPTPQRRPKKTPDKENPSKKPIADDKKQQLFAKAQRSMAKMQKGESAAVKDESPAVPEVIASLSVDSLSEQGTYYDTLATQLRALLILPEFGEVNVSLTLKRNGAFSHMEILSSKSSRNQKHVEQTLPTLSFPPFNDEFGSTPEHTFLLTLKND